MRPVDWRNAIRDSDLDATTKLVCFVISTYMNSKGAAHPGKATISRKAGLSTTSHRAVDRSVDAAEEAGYLVVIRPKAHPKERNGVVYQYRGRKKFHYIATTPNVACDARLNVAGDATLGASNVASDDTQRRI